MLEGKGVIESTDMPEKLQRHAMLCASEALDFFDVSQCQNIACHIKKDFDKCYGGGWQCVVGMNFGCYFTHAKGSFIYFCLGKLNILIFKGALSAHCILYFLPLVHVNKIHVWRQVFIWQNLAACTTTSFVQCTRFCKYFIRLFSSRSTVKLWFFSARRFKKGTLPLLVRDLIFLSSTIRHLTRPTFEF